MNEQADERTGERASRQGKEAGARQSEVKSHMLIHLGLLLTSRQQFSSQRSCFPDFSLRNQTPVSHCSLPVMEGLSAHTLTKRERERERDREGGEEERRREKESKRECESEEETGRVRRERERDK